LSRILRIAGSNFRLVVRLLTQIQRVLDVNQLPAITPEIVDAASGSMRRAACS
jgi:hypothetical protein